MDANGDFVIVWASLFQDGSGGGIYAQRYGRYDSAAKRVGVEFQVNTTTAGSQEWPSAAMDANGRFVIAWESEGQDGSGKVIFAQRYNSDGTTAGTEFQVNTTTTGDQVAVWPSVAMDANGNFVIAWKGSGIFAQRYNSDGTPAGTEFQVTTAPTFPSVAMDANGNFVIAWDYSGVVFAQRYNSDGTPAGTEFQVTTAGADSSAAMDANGNFVIAWDSQDQFGPGRDIFARRYNSDGTPAGTEFQVNTYTPDYQYNRSVAMDANGNFVIAWISYEQDGSSFGTFARRYNSDGTPAGTEFQVNTYTAGNQVWPSVAMDANGNFVIAWDSQYQDGDQRGIFMKRYFYNYTDGSTPAGFNIVIIPTDTTTGETPVTITFDHVTAGGETTLTTTSSGTPPPSGFSLGDPPVYFDIQTTAIYEDFITVCIKYTGISFVDENMLRLFHQPAGGVFTDITTSLDTGNDIICGKISSLSPFAMMEASYQFVGFFDPVQNGPGEVNLVKAGRTIPVKWQLKDQGGNFIDDLSVITRIHYQKMECQDTSLLTNLEEALTSEGSGLKYDYSSNEYHYNWKTEKSMAGNCYRMNVELFGFEIRSADFQMW